jgi:hypothetical protein
MGVQEICQYAFFWDSFFWLVISILIFLVLKEVIPRCIR